MKKIIKGKLYDTSTAHELGWNGGGDGLTRWHESLYQKRTGEYFLHGEGGPMSRYAETTNENEWSGGEKIIPLTCEKARQWAEENLGADQYIKIFGAPDESTDLSPLYIMITAPLMAQIRSNAAAANQSLKDYITAILTDAIRK